MWLFISMLFIFGAIIYTFVPNFRQALNSYVAGFGYWLAATFHIPTWMMGILRWVGHTFRRGLLALLTLTVIMGLIWGYAYTHQNPTVLLYALAGTAILLMGLIVVAQTISGFGKWFGLSGESGAITKFGISFFLWVLIQFALLSVPNGWYMNHLLLIVFGTLLLIAFMFKGWYNNEPSKIAAGFLVFLFIISLVYSTYKNYGAENVELPRWAQNTIEAYEAKVDAYSIEKKIEGQLVLATFWTSSIAYNYDGEKFIPQPQKSYPVNSIVTVAKKSANPIHSKGESMLEIVEKNKYGDMLSTNVWVPARKLEYLSPSELRARQENRIRYDTVAVISKVGAVWYPPIYDGTATYWVVVPPNTYVKMIDTKGFYAEIDNLGNDISKMVKLIPMSPTDQLIKLEHNGQSKISLIILQKK